MPAALASGRCCTELYMDVHERTLTSVSTVSSSEARAALPELLDRVLAGEEVTITRHGQAVAVLLRPDAVRARRADRAMADAEHLRNLLERAKGAPLAATPGISARRARALVADVAAGRSAR